MHPFNDKMFAGVWILTGGSSTGVTRHISEAFTSVRSLRLRSDRAMNIIGIASWGAMNNRRTLIGRDNKLCSEFAALDNQHDAFLLADDGTVGWFKHIISEFVSLF